MLKSPKLISMKKKGIFLNLKFFDLKKQEGSVLYLTIVILASLTLLGTVLTNIIINHLEFHRLDQELVQANQASLSGIEDVLKIINWHNSDNRKVFYAGTSGETYDPDGIGEVLDENSEDVNSLQNFRSVKKVTDEDGFRSYYQIHARREDDEDMPDDLYSIRSVGIFSRVELNEEYSFEDQKDNDDIRGQYVTIENIGKITINEGRVNIKIERFYESF